MSTEDAILENPDALLAWLDAGGDPTAVGPRDSLLARALRTRRPVACRLMLHHCVIASVSSARVTEHFMLALDLGDPAAAGWFRSCLDLADPRLIALVLQHDGPAWCQEVWLRAAGVTPTTAFRWVTKYRALSKRAPHRKRTLDGFCRALRSHLDELWAVDPEVPATSSTPAVSAWFDPMLNAGLPVWVDMLLRAAIRNVSSPQPPRHAPATLKRILYRAIEMPSLESTITTCLPTALAQMDEAALKEIVDIALRHVHRVLVQPHDAAAVNRVLDTVANDAMGRCVLGHPRVTGSATLMAGLLHQGPAWLVVAMYPGNVEALIQPVAKLTSAWIAHHAKNPEAPSMQYAIAALDALLAERLRGAEVDVDLDLPSLPVCQSVLTTRRHHGQLRRTEPRPSQP